MQTFANSGAFWVLLIAALIGIYLLPTLIAVIRGTDRLALILVVNLIGAPSWIGWPAALILAFGPRRLPPEPVRRRPPLYPVVMHWPAETWMQDPGPAVKDQSCR